MPPFASVSARVKEDDDDDNRSPSPSISVSDIEEYEEIEVEEEVEVEVEVEVEEEVEIEEDSSDAPSEAGNYQDDSSKDMECEPHGHLGSKFSFGQSTTQKESCVTLQDSKNPEFEKELAFSHENCQEPMINQRDLSDLMEKTSPIKNSELSNDNQAHNAANPQSSCLLGEEVALPVSVRNEFDKRSNGLVGFGANQTDIKPEGDKKELSLVTPENRARSLSPHPEAKDVNKRPAIICSFFTKGWCIKGNSCRFLHIKDHVDDDNQEPRVDTTKIVERESQLDQEHLAREHGESHCLHQSQEINKISSCKKEGISLPFSLDSKLLSSSKNGLGFISSLKDVGRESLSQRWSVGGYDNCASLVNKDSFSLLSNDLLPGYRSSSGSVMSSSNYHNGNPFSYESSLEKLSRLQNTYMCIDRSSPVSKHSLSSGFSASLLPSHHIPAWKRSSPLNSFSIKDKVSPLGVQKQLDNDKEYCSLRPFLLLHSSSPFSGNEPKNFPSSSSADCKTESSSNDWEPSEPFRPSFFIPPTILSSSVTLYDPLCNSIDLRNVGDRSFSASFCSRLASIPNTDPTLSGAQVPACCDDNNSSSFQNKFHQNLLEKNCHTPVKDSLTTGMETVGTSVVDKQSETIPKEDNSSMAPCVKDIPQTSKSDPSCDARRQSDGSPRKKDLKVQQVKQDNHIDVEGKSDVSVHKESKVMRHFRAALVDIVKEFLKPAWREGHLSKDAHNMIVRKAIDKVLSTLQPHQNPTTMESVDQYLSSSRLKIAKLVQGYVDKYCKT